MNESVKRQDKREPPATGQVAVPTGNGVRGVQRHELTVQRHRECGEADHSTMRTDEAVGTEEKQKNKQVTNPPACR